MFNFHFIKIKIAIFIAFVATFLPSIAFAGTLQAPSAMTTLCNPLNANSVQDIILLLVTIAMYVGVILAVLALIYVGFKFIAAQGNPTKLEEARRFLLGIVIGIAILLGAQAIVLIIKNTLTSAGVVNSTAFTNSGTTASTNSTNSTCATK